MLRYKLEITKGAPAWLTLLQKLILSIYWIPITTAAFLLLLVFMAAERVKFWIRRRKNDRRIIRQAKAAGVWDKRPTPLGGRALELRAWKDFKIKRKPGEADKELRHRCMAAADMNSQTHRHKPDKFRRRAQ